MTVSPTATAVGNHGGGGSQFCEGALARALIGLAFFALCSLPPSPASVLPAPCLLRPSPAAAPVFS